MKTLVVIAIALGLLLLFARPYSLDFLRYARWRVTQGHAFVSGKTESGDAIIGYRVIGPIVAQDRDRIPLVLLHGGFGTDLDWYAEIPTLSQNHRLVLIDTRGHGGSTLGEQPLSYELLADDVIAVLDDLKMPIVDIAGWSDGGNTGLLLALNHPGRIRRLVAVSVNAHPEGLLPRVRTALENSGNQGSLPTRVLRALLSPEPERWNMMAKHVTSLWRNQPQLSLADLASINTPTLIVAGSEDDIEPAHLNELKRTLPDTKLIVIPGVGHFVPQSASLVVLKLITEFLDSPL